MTIVGHDDLRAALATDLPPVVLIEGPDGIGKQMVAREAARALAPDYGLMDVGRTICLQRLDDPNHKTHGRDCDKLTIRLARHVSDTFSNRQRFKRVAVFDASRAERSALNALLKMLEEPSPNTHVIMTATPNSTLPTIRSRSALFKAYPLSDYQVEELLVDWGIQRDKAERASRVSNGRPGLAKQWADSLQQRGAALQIITAGSERDRILLGNICAGLQPMNDDERKQLWETGDTIRGRHVLKLLAEAVRQARMGSTGLFDPDEIEGLADLPRKRLELMAKKLEAPPRAELAVRSIAHDMWRK